MLISLHHLCLSLILQILGWWKWRRCGPWWIARLRTLVLYFIYIIKVIVINDSQCVDCKYSNQNTSISKLTNGVWWLSFWVTKYCWSCILIADNTIVISQEFWFGCLRCVHRQISVVIMCIIWGLKTGITYICGFITL